MKKLILLLLVSISVNFFVFAQKAAPDLILNNGKIFTSDATQPNAEAIAIRGERIFAVGIIVFARPDLRKSAPFIQPARRGVAFSHFQPHVSNARGAPDE